MAPAAATSSPSRRICRPSAARIASGGSAARLSAVPLLGRPAEWPGKAAAQKARPACPRGVSSARRAPATARARTRSTASASRRGSIIASRARRSASGRASVRLRKPPSKLSRSAEKFRLIAASRSASAKSAARSAPAPSVSREAAMEAAPSCPSGSSAAPPIQDQAMETTGTDWSSTSQADMPAASTAWIGREKPDAAAHAGAPGSSQPVVRAGGRARRGPPRSSAAGSPRAGSAARIRPSRAAGRWPGRRPACAAPRRCRPARAGRPP